jgi:hypothetical protein
LATLLKGWERKYANVAEDALPEAKKSADESSEDKDEKPEAAKAKAKTGSASDATKGKGPSVSHVSIALVRIS